MDEWETNGEPWRTESEIDDERKRVLNLRRSSIPDIETGRFPFAGMTLSRADVEWLLATHRSGRWKSEWHEWNEGDMKRGLDVRGAMLVGIDLHRLPLYELRGGLEANAWFTNDALHREQAAVKLRDADLSRARLQGSSLRSAHLEGANLQYAHLEGISLRGAFLQGADLRAAFLDRATGLNNATLGDKTNGVVRVADVRWDDANLAVVNWTSIKQLGDEIVARRRKKAGGNKKDWTTRLEEFSAAVRANRQLSGALRTQGLNESADHFAYRAHILQRHVLLRQLLAAPSSFPIRAVVSGRKGWLLKALALLGLLIAWLLTFPFRLHPWMRFRIVGAILLSLILGALSGHGYRPGRSLFAYLLVIAIFSLAFVCIAPAENIILTPFGAVILSVASFHGRGFFPGVSPGHDIALDSPLAALAAFEAMIGLGIEVSLIATFSRRFFER